ncbi:type II secretion system F family protein [Cellulomonas chengniuliangii]|uniref:Type II secretion system protein GspF domain-containing protein n=1 Tax=Cellulomonas chengniuliangii TaxID=2968084 RepID=A0ABY5KZ64_9CELL|nr:hypothetical protein [Cellulomonas chengniuliangii]MCC2309483.1 hypothetical protein [Cellulomonas chengniuliangii]UUI74958.1 hypothetical protein NP064_14415 [Cellulomonas chengniuliangii]
MSTLLALLVAATVLAARGPGGRRAPSSPARRGVGRRAARIELQAGRLARAADGARGAGWRGLVERVSGRQAGPTAPPLVELVGVVSAALRAGRPPVEAWRAVGVPTSPDGIPDLGALFSVVGPGPGRAMRSSGSGERSARHVEAVRAAAVLAVRLGAPLAPVLERVAEGIVAEDEIEAERRTILAGPRSTATVLAWLPALGLVLGYALGADPLQVVLGGGAGSLAAILGGALLLAGRWWTARMLAGARAAGADA